ncbi:MAG: OmpA family protein [Myxococcales bacterium]|nr:OmpA family protein [Myxococcales bacterium]
MFGVIRRWSLGPLAVLLLGGCMMQKEHDRIMGLEQARFGAAAEQHRQEMAAAQAQIMTLQNEMMELKKTLAERDQQLAEAATAYAALEKKLDDATALNEQLRLTLERAGKSVDQLVAQKGDLAKALEDTKARLEELRKAQEAAQKRAALYQQLLAKFKGMIDAGDLSIVVRNGRMVLQLRNDVLFDSGKVSLKGEGEVALREVAKVLATLDDRDFQVAGHTDNVPISTDRFPSNWELSTARAVNVVKFLEGEGVKPSLLSAAGYGEYDPVASNDVADGKAKNRRIEIVLQPNLSELVKIPGLGGE